MTIIAAINYNDPETSLPIPMLLSDVVLSTEGNRDTNYTRKIYRISKALAISFCDDVLGFKGFLKALCSYLKKNNPDDRKDLLENLKVFLSERRVTQKYNFIVIGWFILDSQNAISFKFDSTIPTQTIWYENAGAQDIIEGSGKDFFEKRFNEARAIGTFYPKYGDATTIRLKKIVPMLSMGVALMEEHKQLWSDWVAERAQSFGFCYELLFYNKEKEDFYYLYPIRYSLWRYSVQLNSIKQDDRYFKYVLSGEGENVVPIFITFDLEKPSRIDKIKSFPPFHIQTDFPITGIEEDFHYLQYIIIQDNDKLYYSAIFTTQNSPELIDLTASFVSEYYTKNRDSFVEISN
jgi:hypothetical protein